MKQKHCNWSVEAADHLANIEAWECNGCEVGDGGEIQWNGPLNSNRNLMLMKE